MAAKYTVVSYCLNANVCLSCFKTAHDREFVLEGHIEFGQMMQSRFHMRVNIWINLDK